MRSSTFVSAQPLRGLVIIHITYTEYERSQMPLRAHVLNALTTVPVYTSLVEIDL